MLKDEFNECAAALIAVEREIALRKKLDKLSRYNTGEKIHKKQLLFHKCPLRNRWVFGGNRSGKTECGAAEAVWLARGNHPYRPNRPDASGWAVSLSSQVQRDVAQAKILGYISSRWISNIVMQEGRKDSAASGVIDFIEIKNVFGGISRIAFKNCEQGREKFQGTSLDFVWFDEEPPRDIYEECRMRVLDKSGDLFGTMTPLKGLTWVFDEIYLNTGGSPEAWYIEMEWADNPHLKKSEIDALTASMSKDELETRRYGKFAASGGLVYPEFDPSVHVIQPFDVPEDWQCNISIDPGLNNPLSAHWYAVDYDGNIYVVAEHYQSGKDIGWHAAAIERICETLKWKRGRGGKIEALIDSAASQRTLASAKSVTELFYDHGIAVNTRVNKDLFSGIQRVKSRLRAADGGVSLYIFACCVNLIREIKGYFWGDGDAPKKKDDHALDELRYFVMSRPVPAKAERIRPPLLMEKERQMRRLRKEKKMSRE